MARVPLLCSFWYHRHLPEPEPFLAQFAEPPLLFLDSGAFSAMTQGGTIDVHDYARWLKRWAPHAMAYSNLDVIRNVEASAANQNVLEQDYGFTPVPVFHVAEPWEVLEEMAERYDYIALGVAGNHQRTSKGQMPAYWGWLVRCFQRVEAKGTRFHGFGISNVNVVSALPFYSVDSSSWAASYVFGEVVMWDQRSQRMLQFNTRHAFRHAAAIRRYGVDPAAVTLQGKERSREGHRRPLVTLGTHSCLAWTEWLRKRHGIQPRPTHPATDQDGVIVFMVESAPTNEVLYGECAATYERGA